MGRGVGERRFRGVRRVPLRGIACDVGVGVPLVRVVATPVVDLGQAANRREVLGRQPEDVLELLACVFEPAHLEQRAAERDMRGKIRGMAHEACRAGRNRLFEASGAAVFLREGGERDGRRIRLDPAFEILNTRRIRHQQRLFYDGNLRRQSLIRERHADLLRPATCFPGLVGDDERDCVRSQRA